MDCHTRIPDPILEDSLEELCKTDLIDLLKENRLRCATVVDSNQSLQSLVENLEKALKEQSQKCQNLEEDRSFLRSNIKKASAHWFERKAKLSESEIDQNHNEDSEKESENLELEHKLLTNEGSHILITEEAIKLFTDLNFKNEQLELSELQRADLAKRLKEYEKVIDDQEIIIHGLEKQLDTYFSDNQKMSKQLADLQKLFREIETINDKHVQTPEPMSENDTSNEYLPTEDDFKDMKGSVSKTYMKLKELIYEKKSLVTEIERLQTLNVELQHRVSQQENRLLNVSDALQTTWLMVSNLKDEHAKIHTSKSILRYELREKREILQKLREELERSRQQWHTIRQMNSETEQEWTNLREELNERRMLAENKGDQSLTPEDIEGAVGGMKPVEKEFEPPIDLLVDMGIEYGVVDADDEEPTTAIAILTGEDVQHDRLQNLEEQCSYLYQKLMASTARALNLASRLTTLHEHYADDEEEEPDDSDDDFLEEEEEEQMFDSESYDTAYVSEADSPESPTMTLTSPLVLTTVAPLSDEPPTELIDDNCDVLSRRLITFLPKKIEILRAENKKLEDRMAQLQEEKVKIESTYSASLEFESRQRKDLEKQLHQLGKCVDELKLERNGKIEALEKELQKKVEEVKKEEQEEYLNLQEKFDQREELLRLTAEQMQIAQEKAAKAEETKKDLQETVQKLCNELDIIQNQTKENQTFQIFPSPSQVQNHETGFESSPKSCRPLLSSHEYNIDHLIILTKDILRIPFALEKGTTLQWRLKVYSEAITFSVIFEDLEMISSTFQMESTRGLHVSKEVLEPFVFFYNNGNIDGRLRTKCSGCYVILIKNSSSKSQDFSLKTWTQLEDTKK